MSIYSFLYGERKVDDGQFQLKYLNIFFFVLMEGES